MIIDRCGEPAVPNESNYPRCEVTLHMYGKVLITGGGDNGSVPVATAEIYQ